MQVRASELQLMALSVVPLTFVVTSAASVRGAHVLVSVEPQ